MPRMTIRLLSVLLFITLLAPEIDAQRKRRTKPSALTQACGTDLPWRDGLDAALADAKAQKRPVFWYVPTVGWSPMDRKREIDGYMMSGPFSDPDVASVIARKFIPVKQVARGALQETAGADAVFPVHRRLVSDRQGRQGFVHAFHRDLGAVQPDHVDGLGDEDSIESSDGDLDSDPEFHSIDPDLLDGFGGPGFGRIRDAELTDDELGAFFDLDDDDDEFFELDDD